VKLRPPQGVHVLRRNAVWLSAAAAAAAAAPVTSQQVPATAAIRKLGMDAYKRLFDENRVNVYDN